MRRAVLLVSSALALCPGSALAGRSGFVQPHIGYGTPSSFVLTGRVLEDQQIRAPAVHRTGSDNLIDTLKTLETDEIVGARLEVEVAGRVFSATTDDDGNFEVRSTDLSPPLPVGAVTARIRVTDGRGHAVPDATAELHILPDEEGVAIISDFDDTVVESHVRDKARLLQEVLLKNPAQLIPVAGVPEAYRRAKEAGAAGLFYVSSSPHSFFDRVLTFFALHRIPKGPVLLKNFGSDDVFAHEGYKRARIESLLAAFPKLRFILVGDSGEKDPEIYRAVQAAHRARVVAVVIRRVPGDASPPARTHGFFVVDDYSRAPTFLAELVRRAKAERRAPAAK